MKLILTKDKTTKNTIRYTDEQNHNIYLLKPEVEALGNPESIIVTIEKES